MEAKRKIQYSDNEEYTTIENQTNYKKCRLYNDIDEKTQLLNQVDEYKLIITNLIQQNNELHYMIMNLEEQLEKNKYKVENIKTRDIHNLYT